MGKQGSSPLLNDNGSAFPTNGVSATVKEGLLSPTPLAAEAKVAPERRLRGRQLPCQPVVCRCGLPELGEQGSSPLLDDMGEQGSSPLLNDMGEQGSSPLLNDNVSAFPTDGVSAIVKEGLLSPTPLAAEAKVAPERRLRGRQLPCQPVVCRCGLQEPGELGSSPLLNDMGEQGSSPLLDDMGEQGGSPLLNDSVGLSDVRH